MATSDDAPPILGYGHGRAVTGLSRWELPRGVVLASLLPIGGFIVAVLTMHRWSRWFNLGQRSERITGSLWLTTAAFDLACLVILASARKRWDVWTCMLLHGLMLAFTVFPGCFAIPWLMHWGPPGPGA